MLINLRNALMGGKRLPYDAEVEYLRGDGRSGIDTGLKPVVGWKYEFTFTPRAGFYGCIFGAGQGNDYLQIVQGTSAKFVLYHSTAPKQIDLGFVAGTTYHCVFDSSTLIMNGVPQDGLWGTRYISRNIAILARYYDHSLGFNSSNIDLHCFKIYDANDVLIFDAIPVRVGTTGYLYDRVSGKLFGNAGTGDFVLGPDVVPVNFVDGEAYNSSGAIITEQGFSRIDDYLPVIGGHSVTFNYGGASNSKCALIVYDSGKTMIDYWSAAYNNERTITMNANGAFARFAVYEESKQTAFLRDNTTGEYIMINGKRIV